MKHCSLRSLLIRPNLSLLCTIIISLAHLLEMFYYARRILSYSQFSHIENEGRFLANDADARAWYYIKLIFFSFCHFSLRRKGGLLQQNKFQLVLHISRLSSHIASRNRSLFAQAVHDLQMIEHEFWPLQFGLPFLSLQKRGVRITGIFSLSPLHQSYWFPFMTLLRQKSANVSSFF